MHTLRKLATTIVDVRTPEEYSERHVSGAINIPLDQVSQRIQEFKEMQTPIVAYCRSGNRSGMAVSLLKQNGIKDVSNGGGIDKMLRELK